MKINRFIDHTVLSPFATKADIEKCCQEAILYEFYAVCVSPYYVNLAHQILNKTPVKIASVVDFPYGYHLKETKLYICKLVSPYVDEVDVVINLQATRQEDWKYLNEEIHQVTQKAHELDLVIKWIVESGNIPQSTLVRLCDICNEAKVDFMKTSTGMLGQGATREAVITMRNHLSTAIQIKASGGIRDTQTALDMIEAGATRIGASQSVSIVTA